MRWRRDYLKLPKKTLGGFLWFFFVKILGDHFGVFGRRWKRSCGNEVCRSLSWRKYKNNPLCNVLRKVEYLILELGMMVEKKEWWKILEVSKTTNNSFQEFMFVFCLYLDFVVLLYKNEYPNFGNSKGLQQSIEFTRSITEGMGVVFCKILETMTEGNQCVIFMSLVLSNGTMVSRKSDRVICVGLKTLRREASGIKKVRSKRFDPLKTSNLFMMKKPISLLVSR